jgi:hypothetical protein
MAGLDFCPNMRIKETSSAENRKTFITQRAIRRGQKAFQPILEGLG